MITILRTAKVAMFSVWAFASIGTVAHAQTAPVVGQAHRYANPLNLPANSNDGSPRGVAPGDPSVVREGDLYYMFASGTVNGPFPQGGAWVSKDFVDWKWQPLAKGSAALPMAPDIVKFQGKFYMSGNFTPLYRSDNILGPYVEVGPWLDDKGRPITETPTTNGLPRRVFDTHMFIDKDGKPYIFMAYGQTGGIWGAPLDPAQPNRLTAPPKDLIKFNPDHVWERAGNANERSYYTYIEGPWVFERNGIYYMQYSASGTEWLSYATGYYTAKSPLGPYTAPKDGAPLLRQTTGVNTGPGHGSAVKGPDGNWWQFYLTVMGSPPGGRRIGMDPLDFDKDGRMFVRGGAPSETPQWGPGAVANPARDGDSGSLPLTFAKARSMIVSSERPGRDAAYALDNYNGTWWSPEESDKAPSMTLDLLAIPPFEKMYTIDSSRIQFQAIAVPMLPPGVTVPGGPPPTPGPRPEDAPFSGSDAFRYRIEASEDGTRWTTVVDKTQSMVTRYTEFDEIKPTRARYVRLTMTDWPRSVNQPLGIVEFTVFGKYIEPAAR